MANVNCWNICSSCCMMPDGLLVSCQSFCLLEYWAQLDLPNTPQAYTVSVLFCSRLCLSTARNSPPPEFSNGLLCYPCPYRSLLPHNVISSTTFWSSDWSHTFYLPLRASNYPSVVFLPVDVSSPFPFRIGYVLDYVCHSGSDVVQHVYRMLYIHLHQLVEPVRSLGSEVAFADCHGRPVVHRQR